MWLALVEGVEGGEGGGVTEEGIGYISLSSKHLFPPAGDTGTLNHHGQAFSIGVGDCRGTETKARHCHRYHDHYQQQSPHPNPTA